MVDFSQGGLGRGYQPSGSSGFSDPVQPVHCGFVGNPQERPQHSRPTMAQQLGVSEYFIRLRA